MNVEADQEQDAGAPDVRAVVLDGRFEINPGARLPEWAGPSNDACVANDGGDTESAYAILCRPGMPWRDRQIRALSSNPCPGVMTVLGSGAVEVAPDGGRRFAIVVEKPLGKRFVTPEGEKAVEPVPEKVMVGHVLPQIHKALTEMSRRGLTHRALRPDNIFYDEASGTITLGDCFSVAPAKDQPMAYEPIERAMAAPDGRGAGDLACDMFALGATVVALITGRNPAAGRTDEEQIAARLSLGSFRAYGCDNKRISVELMALLRGLLCDDPTQRWTLGLVDAWLEKSGRVTRPPLGTRSGTHPFSFGGETYTQPALLARAFAADPLSAIKALKGPGLEPWLANSMRDEIGGQKLRVLREKVGSAAEQSFRSSNVDYDEIVSQMCRALDPLGPVYYKGIVAMEDGMATLLATAFAVEDTKMIHAFGDLFGSGLLRNLSQHERGDESTTYKDPFQKPMRWARDVRPGGGLERCLYGMNPALPCQSPLIKDYCVTGLRDLISALERAAKHMGSDANPVDRHVAAFISDRSKEMGTALARAYEGKEAKSAQRFAPVLILAMLQKRRNGVPLPALAAWARDRLQPTVDALHRRSRREAITAVMDNAVKAGDLQTMVNALNYPKTVLVDEREFRLAKDRAFKLRQAIKFLRSPKALNQTTILRNSHRVAYFISYASLMVSCFWVFYVYMRNVL
jgi:hypothetical protein